MATIKQVKNELRHKRWAEEIAECQSSGMKINKWCQMNGSSCNTYYRRLRVVRNAVLFPYDTIDELKKEYLGIDCD